MARLLEIRPGRYGDLRAVESFSADNPRVEGEFALVDVTLGRDHEIEVLLAAPTGLPTPGVIELARLALGNLAALDLLVQEHCADECERTQLDSDNFESRLAGMSITADAIRLHYWGDVVNTEWDEVFTRRDGKWVHVASGTGPGSGAEVVLRRGEQSHDD